MPLAKQKVHLLITEGVRALAAGDLPRDYGVRSTD